MLSYFIVYINVSVIDNRFESKWIHVFFIIQIKILKRLHSLSNINNILEKMLWNEILKATNSFFHLHSNTHLSNTPS